MKKEYGTPAAFVTDWSSGLTTMLACAMFRSIPIPSEANFLSRGVGISVVRLPSITTVFALTSSSSRSTAVFSVVSLAVAATLSFGNPVPLPDTVPDAVAADRLIAATHNVMIEVFIIIFLNDYLF